MELPELWRTILIVIITAFIIGFSISLYLDWKCPTDEEEEYDSKNYQDETKDV